MNLKNCSDTRQTNHFYGRRVAKRLSLERGDALNAILPTLTIGLQEGKSLNAHHLFGRTPAVLNLEIGFGMGDFLASQLQSHPDQAFVGVEAFLTGVGALLTKVPQDLAAQNLRLWPDDLFKLLPNLEDGLFDKIYVLFPDPWPKKRHHKRRIIRPDFLAHMVRLLKPQGHLYVASDHDDYKPWIEARLNETKGLTHQWITEDKPAFMKVITRFEEKANDHGRVPLYFCYGKEIN